MSNKLQFIDFKSSPILGLTDHLFLRTIIYLYDSDDGEDLVATLGKIAHSPETYETASNNIKVLIQSLGGIGDLNNVLKNDYLVDMLENCSFAVISVLDKFNALVIEPVLENILGAEIINVISSKEGKIEPLSAKKDFVIRTHPEGLSLEIMLRSELPSEISNSINEQLSPPEKS